MNKKTIVIILVFTILLSGLMWVWLKLDEISFREKLILFELCLDTESLKCLIQVDECNSPNDNANAFTYDMELGKKCDDEYMVCLNNIECKTS